MGPTKPQPHSIPSLPLYDLARLLSQSRLVRQEGENGGSNDGFSDGVNGSSYSNTRSHLCCHSSVVFTWLTTGSTDGDTYGSVRTWTDSIHGRIDATPTGPSGSLTGSVSPGPETSVPEYRRG